MTEVINISKMTPNDWADYWRHKIGVNVLPADSKNKRTYEKWSIWQNSPISKEQHEKWKKENAFSKGMAIMPGRIWHRKDKDDLFLVFIDLDNKKAIDEFCKSMNVKDLQELSQNMIVEQHTDDLSRAHLYFYSNHFFKKKSSDKSKLGKDLDSNNLPAIEVKGLGSHGIAMCCPSIHKNGFPYEIIGTLEPKIYEKDLERKLFEIYNRYDLQVDKNGKIPIQKLFEDDFVVLQDHNRHGALLRIMVSLLQRNGSIMSLNEIKEIAYQWNLKHCSPPLDIKEFAKQWVYAIKYEAKNNFKTRTKGINRTSDNNNTNSRRPFIYKIVQHTPPARGFFIDNETNELCFGIVYENYGLTWRTIMDIVPTRVTVFNNPIFPSLKPIQVEFNDGSKVGPFNSTNDIVKHIETKGHILTKNTAQDAFNSIISAFKEDELVEYKSDVTTPGYYLIGHKVIKKEVTQNSQINKEDARKCCDYLNYLAQLGWKNKNIFPTVLKWAILSPFSFAIKCNSDNWLPWLQLYGQGQTGKTTLGLIALCIWNLNLKNNSLGFNHIDSVPRFGNIASRDTYPKLINEVGALLTNAYGRYTSITELIKHCVESITIRGKYVESNKSFTNYQEIPALCPMIFTSNYQPLNDSGFNRRLISIHFPSVEKKEEIEQEQFKKNLEENKKFLKVLGDFVSKMIMKNPKLLIEEHWKDLSVLLLTEFYKYAEMEIPEWIFYFEEQRDAVDESNELTHFGLRAFLINRVNELFSRYFNLDRSDRNEGINLTPVSEKVQYCLSNSLISFLHKINNESMLITVDIKTELKSHNIENITSLKDIGTLLQFKYTSKNFGGKKMRVLEGRIDNFVKFLDSKIT